MKRKLLTLWNRCKGVALQATRAVKAAYRFCTATRFRRNVSIAAATTIVCGGAGYLLGIFAAADAVVSSGFLGQALIASGGLSTLGLLLAATQFGVSTGGGGTLMLYSLATGQYYLTLFSGLWMLLGAAGLAGLSIWAVGTMMQAPSFVVVALAFCHANPVSAVLAAIMSIVALLYAAEFTAKLAFKLVRTARQSIAGRNLHLLPAPV